MPIKPEDKARYPSNWKSIRAEILERAQHCCEFCSVENYAIGYRDEDGKFHKTEGHAADAAAIDGEKIIKIVLTTAHLGRPAQLPFLFHVARNTVADEIVELVGFLVPLDAEGFEWRSMMYDRASAQFRAGPTAGRAGFFVALPGGAAGGSPGGSIVADAAAVPVWVALTSWRLLGKPRNAAFVRAELATGADMVSANLIDLAARHAGSLPEAAFGEAHLFVATGRRTRPLVVRGLLGSETELSPADDTISMGFRFPWARHEGYLYHMDQYPENCSPNNLAMLCQRCHNRLDVKMRVKNRHKNRHNLAFNFDK